MQIKKQFLSLILCLHMTLTPTQHARADFWGGDVVVLSQILEQSILQLQQLRQILGTSEGSLEYMMYLNEGLKDAMKMRETLNKTIKGGQFSNLSDVMQITKEIEQIYGRIPVSAESRLQATHDLTVAESLHVHNEAFRYADDLDPEAERIKTYAQIASPQGAAKASLQSQGIMIHVLNQILRTNASLLKVQSETLALENRKEKLQSEQFRTQYDELSKAFKELKPSYDLPSLSGAH